MRYRIPVILAAVMAIIGLSAPAAFASPHLQQGDTCTVGRTYGPFNFVSNDKPSLGLHYNGVGKPATVTTSPSDVYTKCVVRSPATFVIRNAFGHCIRMHDASSNYIVVEENTCPTNNTNYQFIRPFELNRGRYLTC